MKFSKKLLQQHNYLPVFTFRIPSRSEPNKTHLVKAYNNNKWECDCVGFAMNGNCHHIDEAKEKLKLWISQKQ